MSWASYAICALFVTNLVSFLDRMTLTLLVQPVKESLRLSDGQIGLMQGAGFVVTYAVAGLYLGRLVDRVNRRNLLVLCIALWSVSTALGGFAQSGTELFLTRMGVGLGEAALLPATLSLIFDYYPPSARGRPFGLFTMGTYAGSGFSLVVVGLLLPAVSTLAAYLGKHGYDIAPWRLILFSMLVPSGISLLLVAAMREPPRRTGAHTKDGALGGVRDWIANARVFLPYHVFLSLTTLSVVALTSWLPTVLIREQHMNARDVGVRFGLLVIVSGVAGAASGGWLADRAGRMSSLRGIAWSLRGCTLVGLIGFTMLFVVLSPELRLISGILVYLPISMALVIGTVAFSDLAPARSRGQILAINFFFTGIVGMAGGPVVVGYANDLFGGPAIGLNAILCCVGSLATLVALGSTFAMKTKREDGAMSPAGVGRAT